MSKALERTNIAQATISLDELSKLIKRRNKLIRLADKSPAGWDLVNEYLSDELASGSVWFTRPLASRLSQNCTFKAESSGQWCASNQYWR